LPDRNLALGEITEALTHVDKLQSLVFAADPELEYHHDPNRAPSRIMKEVAALVEAAERHLAEGNAAAAERTFQRACEMEPSPLAYETIEKRLNALRKSKKT
jgi:hypothetical protein